MTRTVALPQIGGESWGGAGFLISDGRDANSNSGGVGLHFRNGQCTRAYVWDDSKLIETGGSSLTPEEWHHIVFIFDGISLKLYHDNIKVKEISFATTTIKPNNSDMFIGALNAFSNTPYTAYNYRGVMDDIKLYKRVLNEAEIQALYQE